MKAMGKTQTSALSVNSLGVQKALESINLVKHNQCQAWINASTTPPLNDRLKLFHVLPYLDFSLSALGYRRQA